MLNRNNKRVLISGASSDIGQAIALKLAEMGFLLALHCHSDRGYAALEKILPEIAGLNGTESGNVILKFDVSDRSETAKAISSDIERNGAYWGVVSNAGITADSPMPGMTGECWDSVLSTNLESQQCRNYR